VANLGWDEVRFPKPLFHGDTIRITTEVVALRESKSRPDQGVVTFLHRAYNQRDELVAECKRTGLQRKRPV
jgi:acyl dehydratase